LTRHDDNSIALHLLIQQVQCNAVIIMSSQCYTVSKMSFVYESELCDCNVPERFLIFTARPEAELRPQYEVARHHGQRYQL